MPNTEIAIVPINKDTNVYDPDTEAGKAFKKMLEIVSSQPGHEAFYTAKHLEEPPSLQFNVIWDRYESHVAFQKSPIYPTLLKITEDFVDLSDGRKFLMHHVNLMPVVDNLKAVSAPVTEIWTVYFDQGPPEPYLDDVQKFGAALHDAQINGWAGFAAGVTLEELEVDGSKGRAGVLVFGWASLEDQRAFRETEFFKENENLLTKGSRKVETHLMMFEKSA